VKKECPGLDIREQAVELAHRFPTICLTLNVSEFAMDRKICPGHVSTLSTKFYTVYPGKDRKKYRGLDIRDQAVILAHRFPLLALNSTQNILELQYLWIVRECPGIDIMEQAVELAHRFPLLAQGLTLDVSEFPWIERYALVRFPLLGLNFTLYIYHSKDWKECRGLDIREQDVEPAHKFSLLAPNCI
jgi:hypothetical protein